MTNNSRIESCCLSELARVIGLQMNCRVEYIFNETDSRIAAVDFFLENGQYIRWCIDNGPNGSVNKTADMLVAKLQEDRKKYALACQKINRAAKALEAAADYLTDNVVGRNSTFGISNPRLYAIDQVFSDFDVPVNAVDNFEKCRLRVSKREDEINQDHMLGDIELLTMEEVDQLYCLDRIDQNSDLYRCIQTKISELLAWRERLYSLKRKVLHAAEYSGEVEVRKPCRTKNGFWLETIVWEEIVFHQPMDPEDISICNRVYGTDADRFDRTDTVRYCGIEDLTDSVKILGDYLYWFYNSTTERA